MHHELLTSNVHKYNMRVIKFEICFRCLQWIGTNSFICRIKCEKISDIFNNMPDFTNNHTDKGNCKIVS